MSVLDKIRINGTTYDIGGSGSGLTDDVKASLDQLAQKVAYIDEDGQDYYDALHNALYPPTTLSYITCVYTQSGTVYDTDSLNSLKSDLVVTAHYTNGTTGVVTNYTLSGTLTTGTSTITVSYGGKTTTFTVTVTHYAEPVKVMFDTLTPVETGKGIRPTGATGAISDAEYFEIPNTATSIVTVWKTNWLTNYPPVICQKPDETFDAPTMTQGEESLDINTYSYTLEDADLSAYTHVYVNCVISKESVGYYEEVV